MPAQQTRSRAGNWDVAVVVGEEDAPPLLLVVCSRITSRSPMRPEAKRAVPPPSEDGHRRMSVLPQFSIIVSSARCTSLRCAVPAARKLREHIHASPFDVYVEPLAAAWGRPTGLPFGRPTTLRVIVRMRTAA
jgi:hypothetical protein